MKKQHMVLLMAILLLASSAGTGAAGAASSPVFMLYGNQDRSMFLGCLTANTSDPDSVWNSSGAYGSSSSDTSIWNPHGNYGSPFGMFSPWNQAAPCPPAVMDRDGNFYGYLTLNPSNRKKTRLPFCLWILESYDYIRQHFEYVAVKMERESIPIANANVYIQRLQ